MAAGAVAEVRAPTEWSLVELPGLSTVSIAVPVLAALCVGEVRLFRGARDGLVVANAEVVGFFGLVLRAASDILGFRKFTAAAVEGRDVPVDGVGAFDRRLVAAAVEEEVTDVRLAAEGARLGRALVLDVADDGPPVLATEDGLVAIELGLDTGFGGAFGCSSTSIEGSARMNMP